MARDADRVLAGIAWILLAALIGCPSPKVRDTGQPPQDTAPDSVPPVPLDTALAPLPDLHALRGTAGVVVWTADPLEPRTRVERWAGGAWSPFADSGRLWFDGVPSADARYRLVALETPAAGPPVDPEILSFTFLSQRDDGIWWAEEGPAFTLSVPPPAADPGLAVLLARDAADGTSWWDPACAPAGCWSASPAVAIAHLPPGETPLAVDGAAPAPATIPFRVVLGLPVEGDAPIALSEATLDQVLLARTLRWGDVHAHTNLSFDGCEDVKANCVDRGDRPGEDFFASAMAGGLDFAALTDHAEYRRRYDDTAATTGEIDLWDAARDLVRAAEGEGFVPLLGYEWTWAARSDPDMYAGGHKTVLLEDPEAPEDFHVGANGSADRYVKIGSTLTYIGPNDEVALSPTDLYAALDAATASWGGARVVTFFHHPGMPDPQPVDWARSANTPDARYEPVVEILSEFGSSECRDASAEGCAWHPSPYAYTNERELGSVQTALAVGHRLGFVGGTDSHDGFPGSTWDGPSCNSHSRSSEEVDGVIVYTRNCPPWPGGITGVMATELARGALFDGIVARNTLASSGLRLPVRVALLGDDGTVWLAGSDVPAGSYRLVVSLAGLLDTEPYEVVAIEVIDPVTGAIVASTAEETLDLDVDLAAGDVRYVRVRLLDPSPDTASTATEVDREERIFVSPWFGG